MKRYKVNMKRVLSNICILLAFFMIFNVVTNYTFGSKEIETKTITIGRNQTLWSIAEDICDESSENLNVQNVIIEIKNINNLESSEIYLGQELNVPIYM